MSVNDCVIDGIETRQGDVNITRSRSIFDCSCKNHTQQDGGSKALRLNQPITETIF